MCSRLEVAKRVWSLAFAPIETLTLYENFTTFAALEMNINFIHSVYLIKFSVYTVAAGIHESSLRRIGWHSLISFFP